MGSVPYVQSHLGNQLRTGCNNRISWAPRTGSIAHVVDKSVVHITNLVCLDGESWGFSKPFKIYPTSPSGQIMDIYHLSWSSLGTDLAVADEHGILNIYMQSQTELGVMNRIFQSTSPESNAGPAEMNKIIGFKWFDQNSNNPNVSISNPPVIQTHAQTFIRSLDRSKLGASSPIADFSVYNMPIPKPLVPLNKNSCIAFTRRGTVRLFTQGVSDAKYYEFSCSADRDSMTRESVVFSHASFSSSTDGSVILAAYSLETESIYFYRIIVEWPALTAAAAAAIGLKPQLKSGSNQLSTLKIQRLLRQKLIPTLNPSLTLSHIHIMPLSPQNFQTSAEVELRAAFTNKTSTVIQKYMLVKHQPPILKNFFSLSSRSDYGGSNSTGTETTILLADDDILTYPKLVISIDSLNFDTIFSISFSDGTTDLKLRPQYLELSSTSSISASMQTIITCGFQFLELPEPITDICVSHNTCSALYLTQNNELCISYVRNPKLSLSSLPSKQSDNTLEKSLYLTLAAVTLAALHATASTIHYYADDLYVVIKFAQEDLKRISPKLADEFIHLVILESYRAINFPLDNESSKDGGQKELLQSHLCKMFTLQTVLGTSKGWKRSPMARVSWATLSARTIFIAFFMTLQRLAQISNNQQKLHQQQKTQLDVNDYEERAKYIESTVSVIRYMIDLFAFIFQELYLASLEPIEKYYEYFQNKNSIAMSLMLSRLPRAFLMFGLRFIRSIEMNAKQIADKGSKAPDSVSQRAFKQIINLVQANSPINIAHFDLILRDIDSMMEKISPRMKSRIVIEDSVFISVNPPQELLAMVSRIVERFSKIDKITMNAAWLYYYDVSWLGLCDDMDEEEENNLLLGKNENIPLASSNGSTESNGHNGSNVSGNGTVTQNINLSPPSVKDFGNFDGSKKIRSVHPHMKELRHGIEIDFIMKKEMSTAPFAFANSGGTRARCSRCGELTIWRSQRSSSVQTWEYVFMKACPCGGSWIPADY
ncbi:uncharacterized protein SAPINGB_P001216 [Magnusiomyces paraingens]|uniref:Mediator of RNA polymerase II transcription subunit 16 n=1 Tax=Magnusiomyces paraingens TaxID=2606893 RepID=A0A5E8BAU3_9ASCO|nr:uncharacterized protein SAPINGB_P001216 [Saprochaete ingens]VVT46443.1 unnamed protein product [Saprochaete ingens]